MKKILIIYHRVDFDGVFSGLISKDYYSQDPVNDIKLIGWNYNDSMEQVNQAIPEADTIVMVDISFPPEFMLNLQGMSKRKEIIWIDHHISAVNGSEEFGYFYLGGVREIGKAAAELTWNFFFGGKVPKIIQYISAYDIWDKNKFNWERETYPIQLGLKARYGISEKCIEVDWREMISDNQEFVDNIIYDGQLIYKFIQKNWKSYCKNYAFPVKVAGKYNGVCLLNCEFGSNQFKSIIDDYDIYIVVNRRGPDTFNISMYKEPGRLDEFSCAGYGGFLNGHNSASGGVINLEQFIKLVRDCEI